jgi:hypothetical protein
VIKCEKLKNTRSFFGKHEKLNFSLNIYHYLEKLLKKNLKKFKAQARIELTTFGLPEAEP